MPSNQLGRSEQHHAGQEQQPHRPVLATTAVPATAFLISRPSNPVSTIVPPAMQHASVVLDHDQFHVPAILLHHHDKFQVISQSWFLLFLSCICFVINYIVLHTSMGQLNYMHACFLSVCLIISCCILFPIFNLFFHSKHLKINSNHTIGTFSTLIRWHGSTYSYFLFSFFF